MKVVGAAALACVVVPLTTAAHAEVSTSPAGHSAAKPKPTDGTDGAGGVTGSRHKDHGDGSGAQTGVDEAGLATNIVHRVRGGYVASGVGLRNRGSGTIGIRGIPAGATVAKAYLVLVDPRWRDTGRSTSRPASSGAFPSRVP